MHALMGKQMGYQVNPQTGAQERVVTDRKPGDFFKSLVAGALAGAAFGAHETSFAGGMGAGGLGVQAQQEAADKEKFARAQEGFKTQAEAASAGREEQRLGIEKQRAATEQMMAHVTMAHINAQMIDLDRHAKYLDKTLLIEQQKMNDDLNERMLNLAKDGVRKIDVPHNGQPGNGTLFMEDVAKHRGDKTGPYSPQPGKSLVAIPRYDTSATDWDESSKSWKDKDGNAVDPSDHATWTVYEVPDAVKNEQVNVSGAVLSEKYKIGGLDRNAEYPIKIESLLNFALNKKQGDAQAARDAYNDRRLNWLSQYETASTEVRSLQSDLEAARKQIPPDEPAIASLSTRLNKALKELKSAQYRFTHEGADMPAAALPKPAKAGDVITPEVAQQYLEANDGDPAQAFAAAKRAGWVTPAETPRTIPPPVAAPESALTRIGRGALETGPVGALTQAVREYRK